MTRPEIVVCEDSASFTTEALARICDAADNAIGGSGRFRIALSGGSTPQPVYRALASAPDVDWRHWEIFWSDERCVPPESAASNYRMVEESLLALLRSRGLLPGRIERLRGELEASDAAREYEAMLRTLEGGELPQLDMILLGMGPDGHTASLFPHTPALSESVRWVVANEVPAPQPLRLTFTFPLFNAARRILFLVRGRDKAAVLREVLEGPRDIARLPSQGVNPAHVVVTWLLDAEAAEQLAH